MDGYQTEFVVDKEQYIVCVPAELEAVGVLMEPLSIVEKAIEEAIRLQILRCPEAAITPDWIVGRRCLVAGLGPVGLLASMVLRLRGADVYGLDVVDSGSARPKWLDAIGGRYVDGRQIPADQVEKKIGAMDLILDASGIASLEFNLLDALAKNGVYVLTGIPDGDHPLQIDGPELVRQLVLDNQVMLGSVNAARGHFQMAVDDSIASPASLGLSHRILNNQPLSIWAIRGLGCRSSPRCHQGSDRMAIKRKLIVCLLDR